MNGKYYSTKIRPNIPPASQHVGAYTAKDVLFGWTAVKIPKGSAKLVSATALVRGKGDANGTANPFAMDLWFADNDTNGLTASNEVTAAANSGKPRRNLIGAVELAVTGYKEFGDNNMNQMVTSGAYDGENYGNQDPLVITPDMTLDVNRAPADVGYSTFYISGIAQGAFDFSSIYAIAEAGDAGAPSTRVITIDGTSIDAFEQFSVGDTLAIGTSVGAPAANSILGVVESIDSTTQVTMLDTSLTNLVDGDIIYTPNPIEIILAFEY